LLKTLDVYIIKELIRPTLFGLMMFGSLWMMNLLIRTVELFVTKGVAGPAVFLIFLYSLPVVLVTAAPMASLLGALLAMGRLNADSELIATKGCGVGYIRLMVPVFAMGLAISLLSFTFLEMRPSSATTASTAVLMPRWRLVGLAPAVAFRRPSV